MRSRILVAAALSVLLAPAALAAPALTVGAANGQPDTDVNVTVTLSNDAQVTALQFDVVFETSKVRSLTPTLAALGTDHQLDFNVVQPGLLRVLVLSNLLAPLPASGTLCTIPFHIEAGAAPGSSAALSLSNHELVDANANVVTGVTLTNGVITIGSQCVAGDLSGNGVVTGQDVTLARRVFLGLNPVTDQARCGDVAPFTVVGTCTPRHVCPNPPPVPPSATPISGADITIIRRIFLSLDVVTCAACAPQIVTQVARVPGDIAPRGVGDGRLDVTDVVLALRRSVGLEPTLADAVLADVAPVLREAGQTLSDGNGLVDIADVVLMLRAAVGLETLGWSERFIDVRLPVAQDRVAFGLAVGGWPSYAEILGMTSTECPPADAVVESGGDRWGIMCVSDPQVHRDAGVLATVRYRGPRVDFGQLSVRGQVVTPDIQDVDGVLTLEPR